MEFISQTIMYFHKGGLVMYPLLFCSFAVFAIAIERFLFYRASDSGEKFADDYCGLLKSNDLHGAADLAKNTPGETSALVFGAVQNAQTQDDLTDYLENGLAVFTAQLKNKLGLLGTIVGMIGAFSIFNIQAGAPMAITGGIGEALIATATGLCVAIMALCCHSYFAHRMDGILTTAERCAAALAQANRRAGAK